MCLEKVKSILAPSSEWKQHFWFFSKINVELLPPHHPPSSPLPPNLASVLTKVKGLEWTWGNKSLSSLLPSGDRVGKPKRFLWSLLHLTCSWMSPERHCASHSCWGWWEQACWETAVRMKDRLQRNHCSCTPFYKPGVPTSGNAPTAGRFVDEAKEHLSLWHQSLLQHKDWRTPKCQAGQILTLVS